MASNISSSFFIEEGRTVTQPPDYRDLKITDPEDYIVKLNEISSPTERLKSLAISVIDFRDKPSHEAQWIRNYMIAGFSGGFFFKAFLDSRDVHADYVRQHNASVFDNKYTGNRHFWDTLAYRLAARGTVGGIKACLITTATAALGVSSIVYRGNLYLPDWIVGYTAIGALARMWRGPRAMLAGGAIWCTMGMVGYGVVRSYEKVSGITCAQMEFLSHKTWLRDRRALLNRKHLRNELKLIEDVNESIRMQD